MAVGYTDVPQQWTSGETSTGLAWCAQQRQRQDAMLGRHAARQERKGSRGGGGQRKGKGVTLLGGGFMWFWVGGRKRGSRGIWLLRIVWFFGGGGGCQRAGWGLGRGATCLSLECFRAAGRVLVSPQPSGCWPLNSIAAGWRREGHALSCGAPARQPLCSTAAGCSRQRRSAAALQPAVPTLLVRQLRLGLGHGAIVAAAAARLGKGQLAHQLLAPRLAQGLAGGAGGTLGEGVWLDRAEGQEEHKAGEEVMPACHTATTATAGQRAVA